MGIKTVTLSQFPLFSFTWKKQGVPSILTLPYGTLILVVKDDTSSTPMKRYQSLGDVKDTDYKADNYAYIVEVFKQSIYELIVLKVAEADGKYADVQQVVEGLLADYIVFPDGADTDDVAITSHIKAMRNEAGTLKGIVKEQSTPSDSPYINEFGITSGLTSDGTVVSDGLMLVKNAVQRVSVGLTKSLTNKEISGLASCLVLPKSEAEAKLAKGVNVAMFKNNKFVYARDITSLTTLGDDYDARFREAQRVAVMDTITRDIKVTWEMYWLGNYQNSGDNKRAFIASINIYLKNRADDLTDPVQDGIMYIDWEQHRNVLRNAGYSEADIAKLSVAELEDIDTSTEVWVRGQVQINGIMEDIQFNVDLAKTVLIPEELGGKK